MQPSSWWKSAVMYQVYPRSFLDTNGDGVGDLAGIQTKLPYLVYLGIDAIWLSPIFKSPMIDFGYDISDHCAIDPLFGTMDDFEALLRETHRLGLKLILDLVPNHTSDDHAWSKRAAGLDHQSSAIGISGMNPELTGAPPITGYQLSGEAGGPSIRIQNSITTTRFCHANQI